MSGLQFAPELLVDRPQRRRRVAQCGTEPGVKRHKRLGEPVCRACQDAKNANNRRRAAEKAVARPVRPRVTVTRTYEVECRTCDLIVDSRRSRAEAEQARRDHIRNCHEADAAAGVSGPEGGER